MKFIEKPLKHFLVSNNQNVFLYIVLLIIDNQNIWLRIK